MVNSRPVSPLVTQKLSSLDMGRPHWEIDGPGTFPELFRSLQGWLPEDAVLYFEGGYPDAQISEFIAAHSIPERAHVAMGTIWPRPKVFHVPATATVLTDLAGRIVEVGRKPLGVNLEAISALAAGCHASTHELARNMGETEFSILFEHEDNQQVLVWPIGGRALLVVLLKDAPSAGKLEELLDGKLGHELADVVSQSREPLRSVPPPRISPQDLPAPVKEEMGRLNSLISELQAKRAQHFTPDVSARLLRERENLLQALGRQEWDQARGVCANTQNWLKRVMPSG